MTRFELLNEVAKRTMDSAQDAVVVDVSEVDQEFGRPTRWLWTGEGGYAKVRMVSGEVVQLAGMRPAEMLPVAVTAVLYTGVPQYGLIAFF